MLILDVVLSLGHHWSISEIQPSDWLRVTRSSIEIHLFCDKGKSRSFGGICPRFGAVMGPLGSWRVGTLCLDTDKVGWHGRNIPYAILGCEHPLLPTYLVTKENPVFSRVSVLVLGLLWGPVGSWSWRGGMLCLDTDKVGWHGRNIPCAILGWEHPLLQKWYIYLSDILISYANTLVRVTFKIHSRILQEGLSVRPSIHGSVGPSVLGSFTRFFQMSRWWVKMDRNDSENNLNAPDLSESLPNCPKMSLNVPKYPKMSQMSTSDALLSEWTR